MTQCQGCSLNQLIELVDFGLLPISNQFKANKNDKDFLFPLKIEQCKKCGLIQFQNIIPHKEMVPKVDWIKYREPEDHLDQTADIIHKIFFDNPSKLACGITYKDQSFLDRLSAGNIFKTWTIDPLTDLGISQKGIASETILPLLDEHSISKIIKKYGLVDLIVARHILEHATNTKNFISLISKILKPGGYILFEVPDCTKQLKNQDYSMPWEEHTLYFTPNTLNNFFFDTNFQIINYENYDYPSENSQVLIIKKSKRKNLTTRKSISYTLRLGSKYSKGYNKQRKKFRTIIKNYVSKKGKIAFYGAGHLAVIIVNAFDLEDYIEFIVDDTPEKQSFYLPGTTLSIKPAKDLITNNIKLCILSINLEIQSKIILKNKKFVSKGGQFLSAFPNHNNSINSLNEYL